MDKKKIKENLMMNYWLGVLLGSYTNVEKDKEALQKAANAVEKIRKKINEPK